MKFLIVFLLVSLHNQLATSQMLRPPPYNFISRPIAENIIETGNFINQPPTVISEPPCNSIVPIPTVAAPPSTTVITDCSPTICQNLANTIQLMIVCNLLQNSQNSDVGRQLAAPILNELMSLPVLPCGSSNSLSPNVISPSIIAPNIAIPNFPPNVITNYIPSNVVGPNIYPSNLVNPNLVGPNIYPSNLVNPNFVAPTPNVISPNLLPLPPRVIAPTNPCLNPPQVGSADVNGLLNTIMGMLGNIRG